MKKVLLGIGYWILQLTWGIIITISGLFVSLFILIFMHKKAHFHKNGFSWIIEIGDNWGGLELGAIALCGSYAQKDSPCYSPNWYEHTRRHEFGHTIQNIILGPLYIFIVGLPSVCRYWYQYFKARKGQDLPDDWYDCKAWFEYTASSWGTKAINKLENKNFPYEYEGKYRGIFSKKNK